MATNADGKKGDDDAEIITEETLRNDKYGKGGVDDPEEGADEIADDDTSDDDGSDDDEGDDDSKTDDESQDDDSDDDSSEDSDDDDSETFIKEFDNIKGETLPEYTRNLEVAYRNSTAEALRLKQENTDLKSKDTTVGDDGTDDSAAGDDKSSKITDPTQLYMKQKMDDEIVAAYNDFAGDYAQVDDPAEYDKFVKTVKSLSKTIMESEGRVASPRELYSKSAVILAWEPRDKKPTGKEKVGIALKGRAAVSSKGSSSSKKGRTQSKVNQAMIELNRKMYPGKTDSEIRAELEEHVQ